MSGAAKWAGICLALVALTANAAPRDRWTVQEANEWYAGQPWPLGSNYIPSNAINQLEMWQAETFDPQRIDVELGWAQQLGMNTMRVFLHDLLWQQDPRGFKQRIGVFLDIAAKHGIRPVFVLFDSCWDPQPRLGPQHPPIPGVHNSGWVQSPGASELADPASYSKLRAYVEGVVGAFAADPRILAWDVWNEPDNHGPADYEAHEAHDKFTLVAVLLPQVFSWARGAGSTIDGSVPVGKRANVGMINWGFVVGKIQTNLPWDSWQRPYTLQQPPVWFHDLLHEDGIPYRTREAETLRAMS